MAISGQRFELDLDAEDFTINPIDESSLSEAFRIKDIQEHEPADVPAPPQPKATSTGFPEHKQRKVSRFKQKQEQVRHNGIEQLSIHRRRLTSKHPRTTKRKNIPVCLHQPGSVSCFPSLLENVTQ